MGKKNIEEIYLVRSIACLCVVFVHSITRVIDLYGDQLSPNGEFLLLAIRLFFTFGTPIFIFLSEFLLAYSYPAGIPKGFMKKRVNLILFPYISMSFIYAVVMVFEGGLKGTVLTTFLLHVVMNLAFGFYRHGYFILVIFQFYFIHILYHRKLKQWNPKKVLLASLLLNVLYLGFFSFVEPLEIPFGKQLWDGLSWGTFPAWIFYFTLGFYIGGNYDLFKEELKNRVKLVITLPIVTAGLVLFLYANEIITINSSKRVDMIFFATSMIFFLFYLSIFRVKTSVAFPRWFSGYSFGIYLFHMVFLASLTGLLMGTSYKQISPVLMLLFLFSFSIIASIFTTYLLGKLPVGTYVVGQVPKNKAIINVQKYSKLTR